MMAEGVVDVMDDRLVVRQVRAMRHVETTQRRSYSTLYTVVSRHKHVRSQQPLDNVDDVHKTSSDDLWKMQLRTGLLSQFSFSSAV